MILPIQRSLDGLLKWNSYHNLGKKPIVLEVYCMRNWYKIAQNPDTFARLEELRIRKDTLREQATELSQQYLDIEDKDEASKFYDKILKGPRNAEREARQAWENEAKRLVSLGLMTIEDAKEQGYWSNGHESNGWKPLPETLYHVTTAKSKVIQEGLKNRDELKQINGVGLGGGESNTISFSTDLKSTYGILLGLREMKQVQEGKLTVLDMIEQSKAGTLADKPFYERFWSHINKSFDMKRFLNDLTSLYGRMGNPPDDEHEWTPVPETVFGNDRTKFSRWQRKKTPKEISQDSATVYNAFGTFREEAGGPTYPLFFSADSSKLKDIPESEIAILEFKPKPGAMGYKLGALGEWRTGTGQGVEFVQEIDPETIISSTNWYNMSHIKTSMANRWIPSITDPQDQLEFLYDCTSAGQYGWKIDIINLMDNNNDWYPNEKTERYLERFVGAQEDDYALRFKYCVYKGKPYIAAYFSSIHYVFAVRK